MMQNNSNDPVTLSLFILFLAIAFGGLFLTTPLGWDMFQWCIDVKNHEVFRTFALTLAGVAGVVIAIWRALIADRNHELDEKKWALQQLKDGSEMIASHEMAAKKAGLFFLIKLAETAPIDYAEPVYEILDEIDG